MANDPVLLDTNVLKDISRGNKKAADALNGYLRSGTPVYISQAAYHELVEQSPRQMGGQYREMLKDLHIQTAPRGMMADRVDLVIANEDLVPKPSKPGRLEEINRNGTHGDVYVVAQAKAIKAKLWTFDGDVIRRSPQFGVTMAPECNTIKAQSPPGIENPNVGRQLLGMNPRPVGSNGQVLPPVKTVPGTKGTYAVTGVADNSMPEVGGLSAKGEAIVGAIGLGFEILNFILNKLNDAAQQKKVEEAYSKISGAVSKCRADNPRLGVVLIFYFFQYKAPDESLLQPGARFINMLWGSGVSRDEAREDAFRERMYLPGPGKGEQVFTQERWILPLQRSSVTLAKAPFPQIAIGRFELDAKNRATFQRVEFGTIGGFDDAGEQILKLPDKMNADFAILNPPTEVDCTTLNGFLKVSVPLKDVKTADGSTIKAVDLDPWLHWNTKAVMVFPVSDWSEDVFNGVEETWGGPLLGTYVNFGMIRWVRPENLRIVRML